jgi:hypothetical protein
MSEAISAWDGSSEMTRHLLLLCSSVLAATAASAEAKRLPSLSRAEFVAAMDVEFRKLDLDNDRVAQPAEIVQSQGKAQAAAAVQRLDSVFKQLDKDKDGKLSAGEFRAIAVGQKQTSDPTPVLSRFDTNRDRKIGIVEYRAATQANFDRIDTDRDGIVSGPEMQAAGLVK